MDLYDALIARCEAMLEPFSCRRIAADGDGEALWPQADERAILFRKDTAYELGGGGLPAYSGAAFTSESGVRDEIVVCGPDLGEIDRDSPYARLTVLRVDEGAWRDREEAYRALRRLDYTRYRVRPEGFMMRISAAAHREPVRVGAAALRAGLDFERVGRTFLRAYRGHPEVLGARVYFVTEPDFPYEAFGEAARRMDAVTESLDEIFHGLVMDCAACRLKPVCDEVEGLRKLHFAAGGNGGLGAAAGRTEQYKL